MHYRKYPLPQRNINIVWRLIKPVAEKIAISQWDYGHKFVNFNAGSDKYC
ncbi:hypothetical protein L579_2577 [Pantoea sp. AS-PWVM4]|nr:hypothetical protein L579_2577 [Pantoea sp. AS-PWVM4]